MGEKFKVIILLCVVLICFSSCIRNNKIERFFQNENLFAKSDSIVIELTDIIDVEWDKMYVIGEWTPDWYISEVIGFEYRGIGTHINYGLVIFIKNNQIIYEERQREESRTRTFRFQNEKILQNVPFLAIRRTRTERITRFDRTYFFDLYPIE
jgi:hypothetical protein